jgi:hypothetical protein
VYWGTARFFEKLRRHEDGEKKQNPKVAKRKRVEEKTGEARGSGYI